MLSCADRLATRGRNADAAIAAHLELARELMAEALDWRARRQAARRRCAATSWRGELGIEPGPELGELLERLREAALHRRGETRDQAVELARRLRENPAR